MTSSFEHVVERVSDAASWPMHLAGSNLDGEARFLNARRTLERARADGSPAVSERLTAIERLVAKRDAAQLGWDLAQVREASIEELPVLGRLALPIVRILADRAADRCSKLDKELVRALRGLSAKVRSLEPAEAVARPFAPVLVASPAPAQGTSWLGGDLAEAAVG